MIVSTPASSANLGPGFDCLALALDLPFRLAVGEDVPPRFHRVEPTHPAAVAFVEAGGDPAVALHWASPIPPGRGLGYSGAARVAAAYAAGVLDGLAHDPARDGAHLVAARLEGHPDNSAASAHGGFTVAVGERVLRLAVPADLAVVVWSPASTTATEASRRSLPARVAFRDAVQSVAGAAAWVAALATGDLGVLREACEDRLHQDLRLEARPDAASVREQLLARSEVFAAWLSGSGPSVAALVDADFASLVAASVGGEGTVRALTVDPHGVRLE